MDGPEIFKFAVNAVKLAIPRILEMAGLEREDLDYLIIHQGNYRILEAGAKFAHVPMDKVFVNIHKYREYLGGFGAHRPARGSGRGQDQGWGQGAAGELRSRSHLGRDSIAVGREKK